MMKKVLGIIMMYLIATGYVFARESNNDTLLVKEKTFVIVDKDASFQGGKVKDFEKWVESKIVLPAEAVKKTEERQVVVQFAVNSHGELVDALILRKVNPDMEQEVLRWINASPKWEPAEQGGELVKQQFVMIINFPEK